MNFWDFLAAAIWPGLLAVVYFDQRKHGPAFLAFIKERGLKLAGYGVNVEVPGKQNDTAANPAVKSDKVEPNGTPLPLPELQTQIGRNYVQMVKERLARYPEDKREDALIVELTNYMISGSFEFVYNRIFGSQIKALQLLRERGAASEFDAADFFRPYSEAFPEVYRGYGLEGWTTFLAHQGLVEKRGGFFYLTDFGREFLKYIEDKRLTPNKAF